MPELAPRGPWGSAGPALLGHARSDFSATGGHAPGAHLARHDQGDPLVPSHNPAAPMTSATGGEPRTVSAAALRERLDQPAAPRLLDVRTAAEFETAHIAGAYNVPLDTLKEHREDIAAHLDEDVVLVCRSGQRAAQAEQALSGVGLPNLRVLEGGMQAWERTGGPVQRGRQRWDLERQVRLAAGSLVFGSVAASTVAPRLKWLAGAVGAGLGVAAVSNTCAMGAVLSRLPYNRGPQRDPQTLVAQLAATGSGGSPGR